jgi:hypothetical protein
MSFWAWIDYLSIGLLYPIFGRQCLCRHLLLGSDLYRQCFEVLSCIVVSIVSRPLGEEI